MRAGSPQLVDDLYRLAVAFWVYYVVPQREVREGNRMLPVPDGDEAISFEQTVDSDDRVVEFGILRVGDAYQIATDIDYTSLLRGSSSEVAATQDVDVWVLDLATRAVRVHEMLLHRWYDVASASHHSSIEAMARWLAAHDPARDYWAPLGPVATSGF